MTRKDLIKMVAEGAKQKLADVERILNALGDVAAAELLGGGEVPLPGVGKLATVARKAATRRNPRTGAPVDVPAKHVVKFTTGKALKDALKG